jgi:hypothetical protein
MSLNELLRDEFDSEMTTTRATLERVPNQPEFAAHPKSMPLKHLAPHIAQLPEFGLLVLTTPGLDFKTSNLQRLPFESAAPLVQVLEGGAARWSRAEGADPEVGWGWGC